MLSLPQISLKRLQGRSPVSFHRPAPAVHCGRRTTQWREWARAGRNTEINPSLVMNGQGTVLAVGTFDPRVLLPDELPPRDSSTALVFWCNSTHSLSTRPRLGKPRTGPARTGRRLRPAPVCCTPGQHFRTKSSQPPLSGRSCTAPLCRGCASGRGSIHF